MSASELAAAKAHLTGKNTQPSQLSYSSTASDNTNQAIEKESTSKPESKVENLQSLLKELYDSPSDKRYSESDGLVLTLLRLSVVHQMELRFRMATIIILFLTVSSLL